MGFVFFLIFLSGCAYPKRTLLYNEEKPIEKMATVYLYRTDSQIDSLNPDVPRFFLNDKYIGRLLLGGYYLLNIEPGETEISSKDSFLGIPFPWKSNKVMFKAERNKIYCVKFSIESIMRIQEFKLVNYQQCNEEIRSTKLLVN